MGQIETKRTTDSILSKLREMVENKMPITAEEWIDAALFLNILKTDEDNELLKFDTSLAKKRLEVRARHKSAIDAENELKTTEEYENYQKQKSRIDNIKEFIRIAKKQAEVRHI